MARLLFVDPDRFLLCSVKKLLTAEGHVCLAVETAAEAWRHLNAGPFDLIMLDVDLPDQDGFTFCRQLRAQNYRMPILFLTACQECGDRVMGLEIGADGYMAKPCVSQELVARIHAHLRRSGEYSLPEGRSNRILLGDLVLDTDRRDAFRNGLPVHLTGREFELLNLLACHRDKALRSEWIFETVWGLQAVDMSKKHLAAYIYRLRLKIEQESDSPSLLQTVRGFGYKLTAD